MPTPPKASRTMSAASLLIALSLALTTGVASAVDLPVNRSTVDATGPANAFAKAIGDLDGDGLQDLVVAGLAGPVVWYQASTWTERQLAAAAFGPDAEGVVAVDIDGDGDIDVALSNGIYLQNPAPGLDPLVDPWPQVAYGSGAGLDIAVADLDSDLDLDIVRRDADGLTLRVYRQDAPATWVEDKALAVPAGMGLALADLDADTHIDVVLGDRWLANPLGVLSGTWSEFLYAGVADSETDFVVQTGDIDNDGALDVGIASRNNPGATGRIAWFQGPADPRADVFVETPVLDPTEAVHESLQLGDFDEDGDIDFLTARSSAGTLTGTYPTQVSLFRNISIGVTWEEQVIDTVASHGLVASDTDGDDDLDWFGVDPTLGVVEYWDNLGAVRGEIVWKQLSSDNGDIDEPNGGNKQVATEVFDVDNDGVNDIIVVERTQSPSVVWYKRNVAGWTRNTIETDQLDLEAGGHFADIDGDGDLDLVEGGNASSNKIWWWENPFPTFTPGVDWVRREINNTGQNQHHDLQFGDYDGDGDLELLFWTKQPNSRLLFAEIPADPTVEPWPSVQVYQDALSLEGMVAADVNQDGVTDMVGGGHWFEYVNPTTFIAHPVDLALTFSRSGAGQIVPGGYLEIVLSTGDADLANGYTGLAPLRYYQWDGANWVPNDITAFDIDQGHSLEVVDINNDGHLDIFNAEMNENGNTDATARVFYGNSQGDFTMQVVNSGVGYHESRARDLDGDGDIDLLAKPFSTDAPRLDVYINERVDPGVLALNQWERFLVDPLQPALSAWVLPGDIDGDGFTDIVAGGFWYRNNSGDYTSPWVRTPIDPALTPVLNQASLLYDFDGDGDIDILGTAGVSQTPTHPGSYDMHWAQNDGAGNFTIFSNIPPGNGTQPADAFIQGIVPARFQAGGPIQIAISWNFGEQNNSGIDLLTLPADPTTGTWPLVTISSFSEGEELAPGDIDGDGDLDLFQGSGWLRNDGATWTRFTVTTDIGSNNPYDDADRVQLTDIDADGDLDAVIGLLFESNNIPVDLIYLEHPGPGGDPTGTWATHVIATGLGGGFSMDVADMDNDGDPDVVFGEHRGAQRQLIFENDGTATSWITHIVDDGSDEGSIEIDHHDGSYTVDFDNDGDLDIVSLGWLNQNVWFFENKATSLDFLADEFPPSAPMMVDATAYSSSRIDLTWERSVDNLFVARYDVYRDTDLVGSTTNPFYTDTGLSELTTYTYEIVGVDGAGNESIPSDPTMGTTPQADLIPPSAPPNFAANVISPVKIDLSWDAASDNVGVIGYRLYRDTLQLMDVGPAVLSYVDDGLTPSTSYTYELVAYDADGNESDKLQATVTPSTPAPVTGLWAAYGFDSEINQIVVDQSGNQNHGVLENGATRSTSGFVGDALEIPGTLANANLGGLDIYSAGATIMLWFNADDFGNDDARLISKADGGNANDHLWMLSTIGSTPGLRARLRSGGSTTTLVGSGPELLAGTWYHVAMTYDGTDLKLYQDGTEIGSVAMTGAIDIDPAIEAWIGANPDAPNKEFDGRIDEVKIFGDALTPAQIATEMTAPVAINDTTPPSKPANLNAVVISSTQVDLSWDASSDDRLVAGYRVIRDSVEIATTVSATTYSDTTVLPLTSYSYEIVAVDQVPNASPASDPANVMTPELDVTPPSAPSPVTLTVLSTTAIDVDWTASIDNVAVTGYNVYRSDVGLLTSVGPAVLTLSDTGLLPGTTYTYQVTAFDAEGNESDPLAAQATDTTDSEPLAPIALYSFDGETGAAVVDHSGNQNHGLLENGGTRTASGFLNEAIVLDGISGNIDIGNFDITSIGTTIMLWFNADDFGNPDARLISKSSSGATNDHIWMLSTVGGANLRARLRSGGVTTNLVGSETINAGTWYHAALTYDGATLRLYQDGVEVGSTPMSGPIDTNAGINAWIGGNPGAAGQEFDGRIDEVRIYNRVMSPGEIASEMSTVIPPIVDAADPSTPGNPSATGISQSQILVSWDAATDDTGVASYRVLNGGLEVGTTNTPTTTFTEGGLLINTSYNYEVIAVDLVGNESAPTPVFMGTTLPPDSVPPSEPIPVSLNAVSALQVDVSWPAATDNVGVTEYRIYRDSVLVGLVDGATLQFSDDTVKGNTSYSYEVTALDAAGNESDPLLTTVNITTPAAGDGLLVAYSYDNELTSTVVDHSGSGNDAVLENTTIRGPGYVLDGLETTGGSDGRVNMGGFDVDPNETTIMLWFNADDFDKIDQRLISKATSASTANHLWMLSTIDGPSLRARIRTSGTVTTLVGSGILTAGTWHHAAMTYDGTTLRLYQDGVEVGNAPVTGLIDQSAAIEAWVNSNPGTGSKILDGRTDDVKIFDRALTPSEISDEMATPVAPLDVTGPTTPGNFTATAISSQQVDLDWDASTDATSVAGYRLRRNGIPIATVTGTSYADTDVSANTAYSYDILAFDPFNNESATASDGATTPADDFEAPTVPSGFLATVVSAVQVDLSWGASTDNVAVTGYRIYRDGFPLVTVPDTALVFTDTGLAPGGTYSYEVAALDAQGNESDPSATTMVVMTPMENTGLLLDYRFDDEATPTVVDQSGSGNDGTLENGAARATGAGYTGDALELDGVAGNVSMGNVDLNLTSATVMLWMNADDFDTADARLISKSDGSAANDHVFMLSTIGSTPGLRARLRSGGTTTTLVGSGPELLPATWIHVAMTYDGSTLRLYQDGVEIGNTAMSGSIDQDPSMLAWIGANPGAAGQVFDGLIDDVRLYGRALTPSEVQTEMFASIPPPLEIPTLPVWGTGVLALALVGAAGRALRRRKV